MREHLSPVDTAWLRMDEPTNRMIITAVLWFDGTLDAQALRQRIDERMIACHPRFRQRVRTGGLLDPTWEDDPAFSLDAHLRWTVLPAPGGRAELQALVSERMSHGFDPERPPWDIELVEGYDAGQAAGSALIVRVHHVFGDGFALLRVLLDLADARIDEQPIATTAGHRFELERATQLVELVGEGAQAAAKLLFTGADHPTRLRGDLGTHKHAAWSDPIPLDAVKAIARAHGATVNDVLVGALAGALRRWFVLHDDVPVDVRAFVPVNLRPLDEPIPPELGNRFGLVYLSLPVGADAPEARLQETKRRMDAIKGTPEAVVAFAIVHLLGFVPRELERVLVGIFAKKGSLIVTNVPGPRERLSVVGASLAGMQFWVPQTGRVALGVSLFSYAGEVSVGIAGDVGIVPDPDALVAAFADEIRSLATP